MSMNESKVDEKVLKRMRERIYLLEAQNQKTKEYSDSEMKQEIIKIIDTEMKKCY